MTNEEYDQDLDKHRQTVGMLLLSVKDEIRRRIVYHDETKRKEPERSIFMAETPTLKGLTYGSDEYKASLDRLGAALYHHYVYNRHHPEHFKETGISQMNLIDIIEMVCDWMAATKRHANGDIQKSININQKRFNINEQLVSIIRNTVKMLEGKGN